ncbi:MAG: hypothetical protein E7218_01255 [Anaerofustis stercorihominis]|nr:hypothetical protein [Anaerofustis stercorihominis]
MTNKAKYNERLNRINDAIALKEGDVPLIPIIQCYPYIQAGYTMADILYDTEVTKARESIFKYLDDYQPDALMGHSYVSIGQGPILELANPHTTRWAGMPGDIIDKNSIHQFIEFPFLEEDEFDMFFNDRSGWVMNVGMPRTTGLLEPMKAFRPGQMNVYNSHSAVANAVSTPEFKDMIKKLWKINEINAALQPKLAQLNVDVEEYGYPVLAMGGAGVPYDGYSDFLRGTLDGLADLYERPEQVMAYCEEQLEKTLAAIKMQGQRIPGKHVFMALHKGMDGFMSDEHYRDFYWNHLQIIINAIIDAGMVPYIYTEGKYTSRLECLKEVPEGKVIYHFEEVDIVKAKKELGGTACIAGAFPVYLLDYGTKQQVIDEVKRIIDVCAPGGGYIFETSCGMDYAKPENVEAMVETVRTYGKK